MIQGLKNCVTIGSWSFKTTDSFGKTASLLDPLFTIANTIFKQKYSAASNVITGLQTAFKTGKKLTGAVQVASSINNWVNKYKDTTRNTLTTAKNGCIFIAQAVDTANYAVEIGVATLPKTLAATAYNIPVINLIQSASVIGISAIGLYQTNQKMTKDNGKVTKFATMDVVGTYTAKLATLPATEERKHKKWTFAVNNPTVYQNYKLNDKLPDNYKKAWISIAADVTKIAIVVLCTAVIAAAATQVAFWSGAMIGVGLLTGAASYLKAVATSDECAKIFNLHEKNPGLV